jgi:hypothetical protein
MKAVHRPAVLRQNITQISSLSSINPWKAPERSFLCSWGSKFWEAQRKPSFHIFSLQDIPVSQGAVRPSGPELVQEEISLVDLDT